MSHNKLIEIMSCGFTLKAIAKKTGIDYRKLHRLRDGAKATLEEWELVNQLHDQLSKAGMMK